MSKLAEYLNRHLVGNVFEREGICAAYATDRSILRIAPKLVALPETPDDIRRLLQFVYQLALRDFLLPITARGAGLGTTGACLGSGLILSMERLNHIEEIDPRGRLVRAQPGVTVGNLNAALRLQGLWLPIAADERATLGGLIATGMRDHLAPRYGGIQQAIERVEMVLANGDLIQLGSYSAREISEKIQSGTPEGLLYQKLSRLLDEQADVILDRSMQPFDYAGYANITRIRDGRALNLLPLLFGSQGTLGIVTDIILRVEPLPAPVRRLLISFHELHPAERFLEFARSLDPAQLDLLDLRILDLAATTGKKSDLFTRKIGKGYAVLIGFEGNRLRTSRRFAECNEFLPDNVLRIEETPENTSDFNKLGNLLLGYLNSPAFTPASTATNPSHASSNSNSSSDADTALRAPVIDEVSIPQARLTDFLTALSELEATLGLDLPAFGSVLASSYTVRPAFDPALAADRRALMKFIREYSKIVAASGGSITGNGPEGRVKAIITMKKMPVGERQIYAAVKEIFDPLGILNPEVKLGAATTTTVQNLRNTPLPGIIRP